MKEDHLEFALKSVENNDLGNGKKTVIETFEIVANVIEKCCIEEHSIQIWSLTRINFFQMKNVWKMFHNRDMFVNRDICLNASFNSGYRFYGICWLELFRVTTFDFRMNLCEIYDCWLKVEVRSGLKYAPWNSYCTNSYKNSKFSQENVPDLWANNGKQIIDSNVRNWNPRIVYTKVRKLNMHVLAYRMNVYFQATIVQ